MTNLNLSRPVGSRGPAPLPAGPTALHLRRRRASIPPAILFRTLCLFISITLSGANLTHLAAQQVTTVAPPPAAEPQPADAAGAASDQTPAPYPDATPVPPPATPIRIVSNTQSATPAGIDILDGDVVITYRDRVLKADRVEYNAATGDVTLIGHVEVSIAASDELIQASHGDFNIHTQAGRFYDVSGSVGLRQRQAARPTPLPLQGQPIVTQRVVYANGNPFLFTGKVVVKTGPRQYQVFNGTITSCQLPKPDWQLSGAEFRVDGQKASASDTIFHLLDFPILWLPYVTHPVDTSARQSGIYIPDIGFNSAAYGTTVGEQVYWVLNRSMDLTAGATYYSARGYEEKGGFRYRGPGQDMVRSYFSSLQDRGYTPPGGTYINQSGTDVTFSGRHDLITLDDSAAQPVRARMVADVEYLSSFPYRQAFSPNFNQAVSTDVVSTLYLTRESDGMAASLEGDRYQGEKRVPNANTPCPPTCEEQVHIIHAPALDLSAADHMLGNTGIEWSLDSSAAGLKRAEPDFTTSGLVERLDVRPEFAYPMHLGGWNLRPSIAGRETFYSRSRLAEEVSPGPGLPAVPVESTATLNRADLDMQVDLRAPVLERTFSSGFLRGLFRRDFRHTIEPDVIYRYVTGINNFQQTLRFDDVDLASDTNELEYGLTQRLFLRDSGGRLCRAAGSIADATQTLGPTGGDELNDPGEAAGRPDDAPRVCGNREWISWRVAQKYFFNSNFGGAVVTGPRAILDTTLDFSGISFMTRPRDISPVISRLRVRPSDKVDIEWDFDYDTCSAPPGATAAVQPGCSRKFTANNVYMDVRQSYFDAGVTYARLDAPARSYVNGSLSSVADYQQMRVHTGFGNPSRPGFSVAVTSGIDIDLSSMQYASIVASYNWNCCGFIAEYRKQQLGTTPVKDGYGFNFTIVNIGSAGDVRHADQVF